MRRVGTTIVLAVLLLAAVLPACDSKDDAAYAGRKTVTVVTQNLLHGLACPADSDRCKLGSRVQLFARQLTEAGCPQVVAVEESDPVMRGFLKTLLNSPAPTDRRVCGGRYQIVGTEDPSIDRELVLTMLPLLGQERVHLAGPLRTALWVRVRAALGPLDIVATHLASGSDDRPCDSTTCPPPCKGDDSLNTCQARQAAEIVADHRTPHSVGVLIGDLNAKVGEPAINALMARGLVDTFVAAKNPPCIVSTGKGCTSGRQDQDLSDLTDPSSRQSERIDYIFLATKRDCRVERPTGLFAAAPADPPLDGLVFASDHTGVQAKIACVTTPADRAAARTESSGSTNTTTTTGGRAVEAATAAAITTTFETVFNGGGDIGTRLRSLQDADQLRESFIARYEDPATKRIVDQVRVRIDSMNRVDDDNVDVVYSILLGQAVVLDHLPGEAVRVQGRWLVSRAAYCQVATLGQDSVPEACR